MLKVDLEIMNKSKQIDNMINRETTQSFVMFLIAIIIVSIVLLFLVYGCEMQPAGAAEILTGKASWYSKKDTTDPFKHRFNADGSRFDENAYTCAMASRDFGKSYRVTNLRNGRSVIVTHIDYNPFRRYRGRDMSDRIIDLTKRAFAEICDLEKGLCRVKVEPYEKS